MKPPLLSLMVAEGCPWHVYGEWWGGQSDVDLVYPGERRMVWVANGWGEMRGSHWLVRTVGYALDSLTDGLRSLHAEAP